MQNARGTGRGHVGDETFRFLTLPFFPGAGARRDPTDWDPAKQPGRLWEPFKAAKAERKVRKPSLSCDLR